ncbi:hypothetical protein A9W98_13415 [Mycobacterium gordonae]|uniref:HNH endonuclease n=1 Tax=Mycobacterium gordonae TaxID=1778 RepID=A0A1A6BK26_MYCGO|nr:hypothetical protein [Mycobacterium gordonae]MBI2702466.1 hypothetical protein [Mycobacterium sp.]OBS02712.1 hypothetical protein A9W98_13415 [Mycobacterium gordonae]
MRTKPSTPTPRRQAAARLKAIAAFSIPALVALAWAVAGAGAAAADVAVGPGPTDYTVQPQPAAGACHYRSAADGQTLPDPVCTPGAISPKVNPDTLDTTICRTGYTKSIRPPAEITEAEKRGNAAAYGYAGSLRDVEYDHLVPLELGGDPNDPRNLWIEPGASPNPKDGVESRLHQLVCEGRVPLAAAQQAIATDWTTALDAVR